MAGSPLPIPPPHRGGMIGVKKRKSMNIINKHKNSQISTPSLPLSYYPSGIMHPLRTSIHIYLYMYSVYTKIVNRLMILRRCTYMYLELFLLLWSYMSKQNIDESLNTFYLETIWYVIKNGANFAPIKPEVKRRKFCALQCAQRLKPQLDGGRLDKFR